MVTPTLLHGSNERRGSDTARRYSSMTSKATSSASRRPASAGSFPRVEDEATGAAALQLTAELGRSPALHQGVGSEIRTRLQPDARIAVGGRVTLTEEPSQARDSNTKRSIARGNRA